MRSMKIIVGKVLYESLGKHLPKSNSCFFAPKKFRQICAKLIFKKCGTNINLEKGALINSQIEIGNRSGIGINARIYGKVIIGDDVLMGPDVVMLTSGHCFDDISIPINRQGIIKEEPIYIGNDVWIGTRVIILPGVHIGNGVVIGAGAVVTKDILDYDVVAGNPAITIRHR